MHAHRLLTNLLYPPACLLCRARLSPASSPRQPAHHVDVVCENCRDALPRSGRPVCTACGLRIPGAFDAHTLCAECRHRAPAFDQARAPWQYAGPVETAIRQFKYHHRWRLGRWFAHEMTLTARTDFPCHDVSMVLPVPPYWLKRYAQGWSPVEELAQRVSRSLNKPYRPRAIRRIRWTRTQTRLRWTQRSRNVQGAFIARTPSVHDQVILLIDDVLTSGATAHACAHALKEAGARAVFVLTAARTPRGDV